MKIQSSKLFALIVGSLAVSVAASTGSFAATSAAGTPLSAVRTANIQRAIRDEFRKGYLNCTSTSADLPDTTSIIAMLDVYLDASIHWNATLNETMNPQTLELTLVPDNGADDMTLDLTPTADEKTILAFDVTAEKVDIKRENTGTLLDPKYSETTTRSPNYTIHCAK